MSDYGYDTGSRLTSLKHNFPADTGSTVNTTFAYNPAGPIMAKTRSRDAYAETARPNGRTPYTLNGLNQATQAGATAIGHADGRGNVTSIGASAYSYGADNLMQGAPGGTLVYDGLDRLYRIAAEDVRLRYNLGGEINGLRAHLAEVGVIAAQGSGNMRSLGARHRLTYHRLIASRTMNHPEPKLPAPSSAPCYFSPANRLATFAPSASTA